MYVKRRLKNFNANINVDNIRLISEKLNELKWNVFLKEKNIDFHPKEIN